MKQLAIILMMLNACSTANKQQGTSDNANNSNASTTVAVNNTGEGLKPIMHGLVCRDFDRIDVSAGSDDAIMKITNGVIVQLYWKDIQPKEGGELVRNNRVDQAIEWVKKFKAKYGVDVPVKIRLYCGMYSPDWLINKGSFTIMEERLPKYWEPAFIAAFADVQAKLAAIYDNVPEVSEIVDGATGLKSAENFIRPFGANGKKRTAGQIFLQAGYTKEKDSIAIVRSYEAMKVWKHTLVSCCYSAYQYLDRNGNDYETAEGTIPFINMFVNMFGKQAVVGNNGLRTTAGSHGEDFAEGGERYKLYNYFKRLREEKGVHIYFQTSTTKRSGSSLAPVIEEGIKYGASYIELPTGPRQFRELLGNDLEPLAQKIRNLNKDKN